ncbi:MAG: hypothetical protein HQL32_08475 [Planctomycetes bacterium]|nr:hypothetical protein [Planctomycetota bacterium]
MGKQIHLMDPANAVAKQTKKRLSDLDMFNKDSSPRAKEHQQSSINPFKMTIYSGKSNPEQNQVFDYYWRQLLKTTDTAPKIQWLQLDLRKHTR